MQGRGLKPGVGPAAVAARMSPLMQGRGLKLAGLFQPAQDMVAPHAGAWIETSDGLHKSSQYLSRPSCRGVD